MIGIYSYGFYIPKLRITTKEIARVWGKDETDVINSLGILEKTVAGVDEDALTMAYEASSMALDDFSEDRKEIKTVFFGSETPPYAVNPAATILAEFLHIDKNYLAYDAEFACRGASTAMITTFGLLQSGMTRYGLVAASDKGVAKPHDPLEYTAASGAVGLLLGKKDLLLELVDFTSFSSDTPDFWRREGIRYPSHGGRFSGKPSYFYHIQQSVKMLLEKTQLTPHHFSFAVFHMPNNKFPQVVARSMGFSKDQIEKSLTAAYLGNSYNASGLMGLAAILEKAQENQLILFSTYGSGAGSDSFIFRVTKNINKRRKMFSKAVIDKKYVGYAGYLKNLETI